VEERFKQGDVMEGVAAVMQKALLAGEAGGDEALTEPFDINALFPSYEGRGIDEQYVASGANRYNESTFQIKHLNWYSKR